MPTFEDSLAEARFGSASTIVSPHHRPYRVYDTAVGPARILLPQALARRVVLPTLEARCGSLRRDPGTGACVLGPDATAVITSARIVAQIVRRTLRNLPDRPDAGPVYRDLCRFVHHGDDAEVLRVLTVAVRSALADQPRYRGAQRRILRGARADHWLATGELPPAADEAPLDAARQREYRQQRHERRYRGAVTVLEAYKSELPPGTHLTLDALIDVVADGCPDEPAFDRLLAGRVTDGAQRDIRRAADHVFGPGWVV